MNIIDVILQKSDLVEYIGKIVPLRRAGKTYRGKCPIHSGNNETSLSVGEKLYYCFSCNSGGNIINFVSDYHKLDYNASVERIAEAFNISLTDNDEWKKQKDVVKLHTEVKNGARKNIAQTEKYLAEERKLSKETIDNFELGYHDMAIIIPLIDPNGRTIAIARRNFKEGLPKYINSYNNYLYDKSSYLFNLNRARRRMKDELYICEGYFDAMAADEQGLACVAYCGDSITSEQISTIKQYIPKPNIEIRYCPDNDLAGLNNVRKVRELFNSNLHNLSVRIVSLPDGIKDFSMAHSQGIEIKDLPTEHIDLYLVKKYISECKTKETQYSIVGDFIKSVYSPMIRGDIAKYLSKEWGKDLKEIKEWFNVVEKSTDEIVQEFKTIESAIGEYKSLLENGTITLGFPTLDASINGGIRKGEVVIIGAYPGVGKTFMAGEIALHCAVRQNLNVLFFSLEMPAGALVERLIANVLNISTDELELKHIRGELDNIVPQVIEKLGRRIIIDDKSNINIDDIFDRIKIANNTIFEKPVDLIIVDYLQLLKDTTTTEQISDTALKLKTLAKENNCIVLALSQLNRDSETWVKPQLKNLKGSSSVEQTGDLVLMGWKPAENPKLRMEKQLELADVVSLSIEKFRRKYKAKQIDVKIDEKNTRVYEVNVNYGV